MPPYDKNLTERDTLQIGWNYPLFCEDHPQDGEPLTLTQLSRLLDLPATAFKNYGHTGRTPFSVFKAAFALLAPDASIQAYATEGIRRVGVASAVSKKVVRLAKKWDEAHLGAKFQFKDGSVLTIGGEDAKPKGDQALTSLHTIATRLKETLMERLLADASRVAPGTSVVLARKDIEIDILLNQLNRVVGERNVLQLRAASAEARAHDAEARAKNADELTAMLTEENEKLEAMVKERDEVINTNLQSMFRSNGKEPVVAPVSAEIMERATLLSTELAEELSTLGK